MRTRIQALNFGKVCGEWMIRFVIEEKKHWWSRWVIRDWDSYNVPRFYTSREEAESHL